MKQYIDKADIMARIRKLKMDIGNIFNEYDEGFWEGRSTAFDNVICVLDTLEVKKVDLDKEFDNYIEKQNAFINNDNNEIKYYNGDSFNHVYDIYPIAKYFFELGLKAQK